MAVHYVNNNNDWLSTLGTIAGIGGQFIPGMQWLTPLGMGINTINSLSKGDTAGALASTISAMRDAGLLGNATGSAAAQNPLTAEQLTKKWQPFLYDSTGGYGNPWLR